MVDLSIDFWIRETGTGQQVAQLHDRLMMMMMMMIFGHVLLQPPSIFRLVNGVCKQHCLHTA